MGSRLVVNGLAYVLMEIMVRVDALVSQLGLCDAEYLGKENVFFGLGLVRLCCCIGRTAIHAPFIGAERLSHKCRKAATRPGSEAGDLD